MLSVGISVQRATFSDNQIPDGMPLSQAVKDIQLAANRDPALALELIGKLSRNDLSREERPLVRAFQGDIC